MHGADKDVKLTSEKSMGTCHRALHLTLSYLLFGGFGGVGVVKSTYRKVCHLRNF